MIGRGVAVAALFGCAACSGGGSPRDASVPPPLDGSIDAAPVVAVVALGQVDRAGRPLVSLLLVPTSLKDEYNAQDAEAPFGGQLPTVLQDALESRLESMDTLVLGDGGPDPVDWPIEGGIHPLRGMFASDALLLDPSRPSTGDAGFLSSYLDLERELYLNTGSPHQTCGGRTPNDDVSDTTLTLLVTGRRAVPVTQGVNGPTKPASTAFPYLAPPN